MEARPILENDYKNGYTLPMSTKFQPQRLSSRELISNWPTYINRGFAHRVYKNYKDLLSSIQSKQSKVDNPNFSITKGVLKRRTGSLKHLLDGVNPTVKVESIQPKKTVFVVPEKAEEAMQLILQIEDIDNLKAIANKFGPKTKVGKAAASKIKSLSKK